MTRIWLSPGPAPPRRGGWLCPLPPPHQPQGRLSKFQNPLRKGTGPGRGWGRLSKGAQGRELRPWPAHRDRMWFSERRHFELQEKGSSQSFLIFSGLFLRCSWCPPGLGSPGKELWPRGWEACASRRVQHLSMSRGPFWVKWTPFQPAGREGQGADEITGVRPRVPVAHAER